MAKGRQNQRSIPSYALCATLYAYLFSNEGSRSSCGCYAFDLFQSNKRLKPPTQLQLKLLEKAAQVREIVGPRPYDHNTNDDLSHHLYFESSFHSSSSKDGGYQRGFCNWLIPNLIMVGQYPGQVPEVGGPTADEVRHFLECITSTGEEGNNVRLFCSLQSELPSQDDYATWNAKDGMIFLEPESVRRRFPHPFTHYAPVVKELLLGQENDDPTFLHSPIKDLNVPSSQEPLQKLLLQLLDFMVIKEDSGGGGAIYLHCWGGRGRAGLVGSCLLSLIWPSLTAEDILERVQTGYASRLGHDRMPSGLARSPQTSEQRDFVTQFVRDYQRLHEKYHHVP